MNLLDVEPSTFVRFFAKAKACGECWIWQGAINSKGYGAIKINGKVWLAHRVAHELFIGPIPNDDKVHHKCMNQRCVNPCHLQSLAPELNRFLQTLGIGEIDQIEAVTTTIDDVPNYEYPEDDIPF